MRARCLLFSILFAMLSLSAQARLGETLRQCVERYGEPIREEQESKGRRIQVFEKNGIGIRASYGRSRAWIFFSQWRVDDIAFTRRDPEADREVPLKDDEIQALLSANADGMEWREIDMTIEAARETDVEQQSRVLHDATIHTRWRRSDGAMAVYSRRTSELRLRLADATEGKAGTPSTDLQGF